MEKIAHSIYLSAAFALFIWVSQIIQGGGSLADWSLILLPLILLLIPLVNEYRKVK